MRSTRLVTFRTRPGTAGWTDVVVRTFNADGTVGPDAIVNSFGGTGNGRTEAKRYCDLLNAAVDAFHAPKPRTDG